MAKKVAEQLVDMLVEAGVKRIYAVTGDSLNEINDAVRKKRFMGYVRQSRILGRRLNLVRGHVHLINGLYGVPRC